MTLAYKLFGIPGTFDELVDKVRKSGNGVDIHTVGIYSSYPSPGMHDWEVNSFTVPSCRIKKRSYIELRAGKKKIRLRRIYTVEEGEKHKDARVALRLGQRLEKRGLEVTVNECSLKEALKNIKKVRKH